MNKFSPFGIAVLALVRALSQLPVANPVGGATYRRLPPSRIHDKTSLGFKKNFIESLAVLSLTITVDTLCKHALYHTDTLFSPALIG